MTRPVEIKPDLNGVMRSVNSVNSVNTQLQTVDSLNNQKLVRRPINKIVLFVENEMVRFPTEETNKGQSETIT